MRPGLRRWMRLELFGSRVESDVEEELAAHVQHRVDQLVARGMSEADARAEAERRLGGLERARRSMKREARMRDRELSTRDHSWAEISQDIGSAVRLIVRRPAFSATVIGIVALAIAASATVFSVADAVLLRPLPFPRPDRILQVYEVQRDAAAGREDARGYFSWSNFDDARQGVGAFGALTAWQYYSRTLTGQGSARRLAGRMITPEFFTVFGVQPALGRGFTSGDVIDGRQQVVILGHDIWQSAFSGSPDIIGRDILLDAMPHTVVGVMPRGFSAPSDAEVWMPLVPFLGEDGSCARRCHRYRVAGRLVDGATADQALQQLRSLAARLSSAYPETNRDDSMTVVPLRDVLVGDVRPALRLLAGAVGLLLVLACGNVAGLLLLQATQRQRELAIRAALGASRMRLSRQLLIENLIVAAIAGAAGVLLAAWGIRLFVDLVGAGYPRLGEIRLNVATVAFGIGMSLATGLVFGMAPAFRAGRARAADLLRGSTRGGTADPVMRGARRGLITVEIALCVILLSGAGLMVRSLMNLRSAPTNIDADNLITLDIALPEARYEETGVQFYSALLERIRALPNVEAAAAALAPPLHGFGWGNGIYIEGRDVPDADIFGVGYNIITTDFFRASRTPIAEGRELDPRAVTTPEVVINQTLADRFWPDESPVGKRVSFARGNPWATIVGVVRDIPPALGETPAEVAYVSQAVETVLNMSLLIRTRGDAPEVAADVRRIVHSIDNDVAITSILTMREHLGEATRRARYLVAIIGFLALTATLLAAAGLYSVLAYAVRQRRREFGIRQAVGARAAHIAQLIAREGVVVVLPGVIIGVAGALALSRLAAALLFGVRPGDPVTYLWAAGIGIAAAAVASILPALRAVRVNVLHVLNEE